MSKVIRPFAERIRQERARLGISQSQLAAAGGISKATQVAYEGDTHVPNLEYLAAINSLGVDTIFIVTGSPKRQFVESEYDWELMIDILDAISEWAEEQNLKIPAKKRGVLIRMLYHQFCATRVIDGVAMARALQLVA
jgi:transcriptional regulator with XRE-family HTH domain